MGMPTARTTGTLAVGTTVISATKNFLNSVTVVTDGTNAATLTAYDNTAASGRTLVVVAVPGAELSRTVTFDRSLAADVGLTVLLGGTGAIAIVGFGAA